MTTNRIGRQWCLMGIGGLVMAGFLFALTQSAPVQAQKTDPKEKSETKKTDKEAKKKKEAKLEPPPAAFPKRIDNADPAQGGTEHIGLIDQEITKGWKDNNTYPSERCTDFEFIRRVSLDIVGRIPTVEEIKLFMSHPEPKRRAWLVNAMLEGKEYGSGTEYAQNFANLWTTHLMTRTSSGAAYQAQMNSWLYEQFKGESQKSPDWSKTAHQLVAGEGDTNTNSAVNYILHNLGEEIKQDAAKNGKYDMVPATSRTTRLFLGIRTQCVQCHDHPFNGEWGQHHFWGINAFLRQADASGRPTMMGKKKKGVVGMQQYTVKDRPDYNTTKLVGYERRNAVLLFTDPSFLDGKKIPKDFKGTRREKLAEYVTASPWFAKAFVNRMWGHFFGASFIKGPVDDFHEQNPVSHPELLDKLAKDWAEKYAHNPKVVIRWICNSQAYGLSSRSNKWNDKTDDEALFARMLLKPMSPEQMFASVTVATHARWHSYSEDKKQAKLADGEKWYKKLVDNFGNDEGEEGSYSGTVIQALLLMNGQDINAMISDPKEGTAAYVEGKRGSSYKALPLVIGDLYMHVLNRPPTAPEVKDMMLKEVYSFRPGSKTSPASPGFWTNYYQDITWALLNSNEFILNH